MENEPNAENYTSELLSRINLLRSRSLDTIDNNIEFNEAVANFNVALQRTLATEYGDPVLCKRIPEWHRLVGSTVEVHDIDQESKRFILEQISQFVSGYEEKWNL